MFFANFRFCKCALGVCVALVISLTSSLLVHGLCLCLSEWGMLWCFVLVVGLLLSIE